MRSNMSALRAISWDWRRPGKLQGSTYSSSRDLSGSWNNFPDWKCYSHLFDKVNYLLFSFVFSDPVVKIGDNIKADGTGQLISWKGQATKSQVTVARYGREYQARSQDNTSKLKKIGTNRILLVPMYFQSTIPFLSELTKVTITAISIGVKEAVPISSFHGLSTVIPDHHLHYQWLDTLWPRM